MKILLISPIVQGAVGGPASVSRSLARELESMGDTVSILTPLPSEMRLPMGLRQVVLLFRFLRPVFLSDVVVMFDPVSTGLPAIIAARLFGKPNVLRIGGDFLWESYVNRTNYPVLLSEFYVSKLKLTLHEKIIKMITGFVVQSASRVIFSTRWQKEIWEAPYRNNAKGTQVVANALPNATAQRSTTRTILASGRDTRVKNIKLLQKVWNRIGGEYPDMTLLVTQLDSSAYREAMASCFAIIQPSLSEVSPNTILEAVAYGKPFIATRDTGIYEEYKDAGIFIDTRDESSLEQAIRKLLDEEHSYSFAHKERVKRSWKKASSEFREVILDAGTSTRARKL